MAAAERTVLFLCAGNTALSVMAEALLNARGGGVVCGVSAGSEPAGVVHPIAVELLRLFHIPTDYLRSKGWDEFATAETAPLHFVITLAEPGVARGYPAWRGDPVASRWLVHDPATIRGAQTAQWIAFISTFTALERRIAKFLDLKFDQLDRERLQRRIDDIAFTSDPNGLDGT